MRGRNAGRFRRRILPNQYRGPEPPWQSDTSQKVVPNICQAARNVCAVRLRSLATPEIFPNYEWS